MNLKWWFDDKEKECTHKIGSEVPLTLSATEQGERFEVQIVVAQCVRCRSWHLLGQVTGVYILRPTEATDGGAI
jgi:hypothetical protein